MVQLKQLLFNFLCNCAWLSFLASQTVRQTGRQTDRLSGSRFVRWAPTVIMLKLFWTLSCLRTHIQCFYVVFIFRRGKTAANSLFAACLRVFFLFHYFIFHAAKITIHSGALLTVAIERNAANQYKSNQIKSIKLVSTLSFQNNID